MEYAPRVLSWNLTSRCNLKCAHCYLSAGDRAPRELTTQEALSVVDQAAQAGTGGPGSRGSKHAAHRRRKRVGRCVYW